MIRRTIWTPPGRPRAAERRQFITVLGGVSSMQVMGLYEFHRTGQISPGQGIVAVSPGQIIVAARSMRAGEAPGGGGPMTVSAAGWLVADPLRLLNSGTENVLWWTYLTLLAEKAAQLELPTVATQWVAGELDMPWREAQREQPQRLHELTRVASAAMAAVADGEVSSSDLTGSEDGREAWASMLRPDLGRLGWKAALSAVTSGQFTPEEIEPWGPMLDVSGVAPDAGLEGAPKGKAEHLKLLARSAQGHARGSQGKQGQAAGQRRGGAASGAGQEAPTSLERNTDWIHQHPEVQQIWASFAADRRSRTVSRLAYQLGSAARDAAMAQTMARVQKTGDDRKETGERPTRPTGLARAMGELSLTLKPVLAGVRGDKSNQANERRVDQVLLAWSEVGQDIPHLRPALSELQLELDPLRCLRLRVSGVALSPETKTVFVNLGAGWDTDQLRYGFAELALHLLLGHPVRASGKDPELWNLACDLLLAGWLQEMGYGTRPDGAPYDDVLSRLPSAEAIYLRLLDDPNWKRRAPSLRGEGLPDMIGAGEDAARAMTEDEDRLWRQAAARGMEDAQALQWAGSVPAGLLRELSERAAAPIPWRPALQAYLGSVVPTRVRRRSYARPSRRASTNPLEPRAARDREEPGPRHSLILVVDTSGSVSDRDLAEALGGVRTTCAVLGIERVRVLSCDAGVTDHGWAAPWRAGERVKLTGGGGTSLVPALQLADQLASEPDGVHPGTPMLIFTDGLFEGRLAPGREHAYLMPPGCRLLFPTAAPVFTVRGEK